MRLPAILLAILAIVTTTQNLRAQPATNTTATEMAHAMVPHEGVACLSVRVQQIKQDQAVRMIPWEILAAGSIDQLGLDFSNIDRFDLIVGPVGNTTGAAGILTSTTKMDSFQLNNKIFAREGSGRSLRIIDRGMNDIVITPLNDNQIAVSVIGSLEPIESAARSEGFLIKQMKRLGETAHVSLVVVPHPMRSLLRQGAEVMRPELREDAIVLIEKIELIAARMQVNTDPVINVLIESENEADAQAVETSWNRLAGRLAMMQLGQLPTSGGSQSVQDSMRVYMTRVADEILLLLKPTRKGNRLLLTLDQRAINLARGLTTFANLMPTLRAAARSSSAGPRPARPGSLGDTDANKLKMLGLAMHNFHDAFKTLPTGGEINYDNTKQLSWRVRILPFLGDPELTQLFQQFKLNEPWDSENNSKLLARMPAIYRYSKAKTPLGHTVVQVPFGPGLISEAKKRMPFREVTDGLSKTVLIAISKDEAAVPWTKPDDFNPFENPDLIRTDNGKLTFILADGSTSELPSATDPGELKAFFTRAGND